jgi:hypothetical protein
MHARKSRRCPTPRRPPPIHTGLLHVTSSTTASSTPSPFREVEILRPPSVRTRFAMVVTQGRGRQSPAE